jgi:hypothetical protein
MNPRLLAAATVIALLVGVSMALFVACDDTTATTGDEGTSPCPSGETVCYYSDATACCPSGYICCGPNLANGWCCGGGSSCSANYNECVGGGGGDCLPCYCPEYSSCYQCGGTLCENNLCSPSSWCCPGGCLDCGCA